MTETRFRPRLLLVALGVVGLMVATWGCAERQNFDRWIAQQPVTVKYEPVPCDNPAFVCGQLGGFDSAHNTIYIDQVAVAKLQNYQNLIDPSINVRDQIYYHEWGHVADRATGFVIEGATSLGFERTAQCVMQLITGRAYIWPGGDPFVYWICPPAELARTRWYLTAYRIIA